MRILMKLKDQRKFLRAVKEKCKLSWKELGRLCGVGSSTAKVNYFFRGNTLPLDKAQHLAHLSGLPLPPHQLLLDNWGQIKGGLISSRKARVAFKNPKFSADLAELVGILLGDGCIFRGYSKSEQRPIFLVNFTSHVRDEEYYQSRVRPMIRRQFGVNGYLQRRKNTIVLVLRSKRVYGLLKSVGMPEGKKIRSNTFLIPEWIKSNPDFLKACVRGITDTDGSIFRSGKNGVRIQYKFASALFTNSLHEALIKLGYHPGQVNKTESFSRIREKRYVGWRFYISKQEDIDRFVVEIGFGNKWHEKRYWRFRKGSVPREVTKV